MRDDYIVRHAPTGDGSRKVRCRQCSDTRKKKHDTPLSITRKGSEVMWMCHHCDWKGGYDEARREDDWVGGKKKNQRGHTAKDERWRRNHTVW